MEKDIKRRLTELFETHFDEPLEQFITLPGSGSYRVYYRMISENNQVIGTYNADLKENIAFIEFTNHFLELGLNVPEIIAVGQPQDIYLQTDLGDTTLFGYIERQQAMGGMSQQIIETYKRILELLPQIQIRGAANIDWNNCYPRQEFDEQSMMWDLNYFKYYFLKLAKVPFEEQLLENDYKRFIDFLLEAPHHYFMFRDFQSRNIMLHNNQGYFIDYQGGRKGALQYDVASLLFDAKANIPAPIRTELLEHYLDSLCKIEDIDRDEFKKYYHGYVLIRIMQAMGAFGFRGFYERKTHFLESIPFALNNLEWLLKNLELDVELPHLKQVLYNITQSHFLKNINKDNRPTTTIHLISYQNSDLKKIDGPLIDCRPLRDLATETQWNKRTKETEIVEAFSKLPELDLLLQPIFQLCDIYISQQKEVNIYLGSEQGMHRALVVGRKLANYLEQKGDVRVKIIDTID